MKVKFALLSTYLSLITGSILSAEDRFYIGTQGGVNILDNHFLTERHFDFDKGLNLGAVGGYEWLYGIRLEGEITYRYNPHHLNGRTQNASRTKFNGKVNSWAFMANGYYDLPICFKGISPYVGIGLGFDHVHQSIRIGGEKFRRNHSGFAWQAMGGLNTYLCSDIVISAEYKYHRAPFRHPNHFQNHSITVGVKKLLGC